MNPHESDSERAETACVGCGAPKGYPPAGPCRNHGTSQAITIEIGGTADGEVYITAKGDLLKEVWPDG